MAAKKKPAGKPTRGRMPVKRSINLMLVDENRASVKKAVPAILAIIVLAGLFSKFLVADRLESVSRAQARVTRLQEDLDNAMAALDSFGEIEQTYAHYTLADMTQEELDLVDRTQVLELVGGILPPAVETPTAEETAASILDLFRAAPKTGNDALDQARDQLRASVVQQTLPTPEYVINTWSASGNLLTIEVTGKTLERMNELARQLEQSPIVNSCTISTANMDDRNRETYEGVRVRFIVYLQQTAEGAGEQTSATSSGSNMPNFSAVTQFIGGEAEQP